MRHLRTMRWLIPSIAMISAALAGCSHNACHHDHAAAPEAAEAAVALHPDAPQAPAFTLPDTHGTEHSLSDFRGGWVILEWINHDCPFVVKHYATGNMQQLQEHYTDKGVVWLSICSSAPGKQGYESPERWNELTAEKNAQPTAVLLDPDGTVGRAYEAKTTPQIVVIDPAGRLIYNGAIDDTPSRRHADVEGAVNYVREVMDAVLAGAPAPVRESRPYGCSVKY